MRDEDIAAISTWLVGQGLAGTSEAELVAGFCSRCAAAGLALSRGLALVDTLHPVYEGRAFHWQDDLGGTVESVYGRTDTGEAAEDWRRSAWHHIVETGCGELRRHFGRGDPCDFHRLVGLRDEGHHDFFALVTPYSDEDAFGLMDCVYSQWLTRMPDGFSDAHIAALRRLVPVLALALKGPSLARIARTLVEVYLGRDAGERVLSGRISRGVADEIDAVLWFSDLRGYTTISDTAAPGEIIPLLNDYAEAAISAVDAAGGDVLKLIGDGILAIFKADDPAEACRCALAAEADLRARLAALNARRAAAGRPVTTLSLGLHIGAVFYGNIGAESRLDFTVVGPAVNEVSRIAAMCRSADRGVLLSSAFHDAAPGDARAHIVSVGRYALRGVGRAQELFTLDETA
ncbi:adenylate/guanylate cyclase domain-containing protein [Lichenibacterium minor]|uniref:Adenylate/guanylate cyclase domain-containing protein n=1 Tax=Lichenibacterium minor TaxID=2316528 RepID=A0A4Q2U4A4_9HYPH|nr:adenylate/guanylate cyclase domain-containing protein [Lichenibacterium minor]RYC31192.1 adenylate/guanylate cyclase domain-containing protein [Lichenibacterium minor]